MHRMLRDLERFGPCTSWDAFVVDMECVQGLRFQTVSHSGQVRPALCRVEALNHVGAAKAKAKPAPAPKVAAAPAGAPVGKPALVPDEELEELLDTCMGEAQASALLALEAAAADVQAAAHRRAQAKLQSIIEDFGGDLPSDDG